MYNRQELVFIGCNLKEAVLREHLDGCLLTDQEMQDGPQAWTQPDLYPDPFPEIVLPLEEEGVDAGNITANQDKNNFSLYIT